MFNFCPMCKSTQINTTKLPFIECSDCGFTYFHNCASAVAAIVCCDNQILFNVRAQQPALGCLDLPGGFVDYDEGLEQALTRELKEELNIEITQWQYFCSQPNTYQYKDITYQTTDSIFVSYLESKPNIILELEEVSDFVWVNLNDINIEDIGFKSIRQAIALFIQQNEHLQT